MESANKQQYFFVSGIATETRVECIHAISPSSIAERAREWLSNNGNESDGKVDCAVTSVADETPLPTGNDTEVEFVTKSSETLTSRAKRKQDIQDHLSLKPSLETTLTAARNTTTDGTNEVTATGPSLKPAARRIITFEDELLTLQSSFHGRLLDAARSKIFIRDTVDLNNERLSEIHKLLKNEGDAPIVGVQVKCLPGEYTSTSEQTHATNKASIEHDAKKFYLRGSVHDSDFIMYQDVNLSDAAKTLKAQARDSLQNESMQLIQSTRAMISAFDDSLLNLEQTQLQLSLKLKLRGLSLDIQLKQLEVLLNHEAKVESLRSSELNDKENLLKTAMSERDNELQALEAIVAVHIEDLEVNTISEPMLVAKVLLDDLNNETSELESKAKEATAKHSDLRRQQKRLTGVISKLKGELTQHMDVCKELQIQKFGRLVDSSVLDMSPITRAGQSEEVEQLQDELESFHRQDLEKAKNEQAKLKVLLLSTTQENTKLLREAASLRDHQLKVDEKTKRATSLPIARDKLTTKDDKAEYERFLVTSSRQKEEIEMLQMEIKSLKTKCGHVAAKHVLGPF
jgi:hypothetical protein